MTERPWELLAEAGAPRPLRPETRDRLEALLQSQTPWYDEESAFDPEPAALARVGEPRSLPDEVRARLEAALPSVPRARRRPVVLASWLAAAASVVVLLAFAGAWLQRDDEPPSAQLATGQATPTGVPTAEPGVGTGTIGGITAGGPSADVTGSSASATRTPDAISQPAPAAAAGTPPTASTTSTPSARPAVPQVTRLTPSSGPASGGTWVTVTGVALGGATSVVFGDAPAARVVQVSDTSLRVLSPEHLPGPVDVRVTTPGGTSEPTASSQYLYLV